MLCVVVVPGRCASDVEPVFSHPHADEPLYCCRFRDETPQSGEDGIPTREHRDDDGIRAYQITEDGVLTWYIHLR